MKNYVTLNLRLLDDASEGSSEGWKVQKKCNFLLHVSPQPIIFFRYIHHQDEIVTTGACNRGIRLEGEGRIRHE